MKFMTPVTKTALTKTAFTKIGIAKAVLTFICVAPMLTACGGNNKWAWQEVAESKCASGTTTGFGINPHAGSTRLVIYLEGGGSCYDMDTCWVDPKAANTAGYGKTEFTNEPKLKNYLIFNRDPNSGNPFADANMAFIPYCTGDYHSGYNMRTLRGDGTSKDTYFWGGKDMDLFLTKIRARFPAITQVWLVGTSAGGVGTTANYYKVRDTFNVRTDVINDSGTPLNIEKSDTTLNLWGTPPLPGCETCTTLEQKVQSIRSENPSTRYALMSFDYDNVVAKNYEIDLDTFNTALNQTLSDFSPDANFASFTVGNPKSMPQHVVMGHFGKPALMQAMSVWLSDMVNDEPWVSTHITP